MFIKVSVVLAALIIGPALASAQNSPPQKPADQTFTDTVVVIGTTPLVGVEVPIDRVPAPAQTATAKDFGLSGALDVSDLLNRRFTGVHVNETQSNPFQVDLNYRGYTASPLLGTPQGLSVYMDGVRLNQPFGENVSWDLIPKIAIQTTTLIPGSNPIFGLNTLGGALALESKSGLAFSGTTIEGSYGSDFRRSVDVEHGGHSKSGTWHWYGAGSFFGEDGWRAESPSNVRQLFGKIGWLRGATDATVTAAHSDNSLNGNGLQEFRMLARDRSDIYTKPDITDNRSTLITSSWRRQLSTKYTLLANGYFRHIRTSTLNGDINEESLDQSLYQPNAAERAALAAAGYGSIPATGLDATTTPFPSLRCIANVLLHDEPAEKCNGLINRAHTLQKNGGGSVQLLRRDRLARRENLLIGGAAYDRSRIGFVQSSELGYLSADRGIVGLGAIADGEAGGNIDGEPFDTRVDLDGTITIWSVYATDTLPLKDRIHITLSGRYNRTTTSNRDHINPGGGEDSLDGDHAVGRFNPAAGLTIALPRNHNVYAGYSEGSRTATSVELGCANPENPCKLPNAMTGDPPLKQVITRTIEAGVRGTLGRTSWNAGAFRANNSDDILFVMSEQTGFGYFRNFGQTRRQGFELGGRLRIGRATIGSGYTFLRATFENPETVNGEGNSTNDSAVAGLRGVEGSIEIEPGNRIPLVPAHLLKLFADVALTARVGLDLDVVATSGSFARGNENNAHQPDGTYYLGDGYIDGYAVVNVGGRVTVTRWLQLTGQINNLFDREYATGAQLGASGFTSTGVFESRALPSVAGIFPIRQSTFVAPGAPRRAWVGTKISF